MRRIAAVTLCLALACVTWPGVVAATAAPAVPARVTVAEFTSRLVAARALVVGAENALETSAEAASLADRVDALLPSTAVVTEGAGTIDVDLRAAGASTAQLREAGTATARRSAAADLASRLASLRSAVGATAAAPADPSDPAALRELVAALPSSGNAANDWLDQQITKVLEAISRWLASLSPNGAAPASGANRAVTLLVVLVPVLLAIVVLVLALRSRRRRAAANPPPRPDAAASGPAVAAAAELPPDALGYAHRLAAAGAHREAVRALYGGAARHLVEAGIVRRMRTRTDLEMLHDVADSAPALEGPFAALTGDFERVWYGHAETDGAGFDRARAEYERVVGGSTVTAPRVPRLVTAAGPAALAPRVPPPGPEDGEGR